MVVAPGLAIRLVPGQYRAWSKECKIDLIGA
jgi:hypothetical protein